MTSKKTSTRFGAVVGEDEASQRNEETTQPIHVRAFFPART